MTEVRGWWRLQTMILNDRHGKTSQEDLNKIAEKITKGYTEGYIDEEEKENDKQTT